MQFSLLLLLQIAYAHGHDPQIDFLKATVADLIALLESRAVTSEDLIHSYLFRINENNHRGLCLRAVLETAPLNTLVLQAKERDAEREKGKQRGPLHGIPVLVKDNIATDPSLLMNTTAGSLALRDSLDND